MIRGLSVTCNSLDEFTTVRRTCYGNPDKLSIVKPYCTYPVTIFDDHSNRKSFMYKWREPNINNTHLTYQQFADKYLQPTIEFYL